jgi:hypothetical protein
MLHFSQFLKVAGHSIPYNIKVDKTLSCSGDQMRAVWWLLLGVVIFNVTNAFSYQVATQHLGLQSPIIGVGLTLAALLWIIVVAQALFSRINRVMGYLFLNAGAAFCLFLASVALGMFLDVYLRTPDRQFAKIALLGGIFIAALCLLWSIVTLVRGQHSLTLPWRILENHILVRPAPALQQ